MKIKITRNIFIAGKPAAAGDIVDLDAKLAKELIAMKKAVTAPDEKPDAAAEKAAAEKAAAEKAAAEKAAAEKAAAPKK